MEREERELLFRDLSARLPYRTKIQLTEYSELTGEKLPSETRILDYYTLGKVQAYCRGVRKDEVRPYLFPISSVTEDQAKELFDLFNISIFDSIGKNYIKINECTGITFFLNRGFDVETHLDKLVDWLNAHHFDYRGLIEKHLAIDATLLDVY